MVFKPYIRCVCRENIYSMAAFKDAWSVYWYLIIDHKFWIMLSIINELTLQKAL